MSKRRQQTQVANFLRPAWLDDMGKRTGIGAAIVTPASTFKDFFDNYGGPGFQGGSDVLYWRQIARMETGESWGGSSIPTPTFDDTWKVEGQTSLSISNSGGPSGVAFAILSLGTPQDLDEEGRFTGQDFIEVVVNLSVVPDGKEFEIVFVSGSGGQAGHIFSGLTTGVNYLRAKRQDFFAQFTFEWSDVTHVGLRFQHSSTITVRADDLRIVKADPDNLSVSNDTGLLWDFDGGVWHVYYRAVPGVPYSLGQIKTAASVRYTGTYVGERAYSAVRDAQVGVYLREEGRAGLWWGVDADDCYALILDTDADALELLKYVDGTPESLGSVDFPAGTFTKYYLGLRRETTHLRVYCSTSRVNLFDRANMQFAVEDRDYAGGIVGTVAEGIIAHFFEFQGGSPFHSDTAQNSMTALEVYSGGDDENEPAGAVLLADGTGGSKWGEVDLTNDNARDGVLPAAYGGTGLPRLPGPCQGRLTLESGNPVTTANQTAKTTVYCTPYGGALVALYDGSFVWKWYVLSEISVTVPSTTNTPFDIFLYDNAGTLALETVNWSSDTARATALALQDGILVKSGDPTRRYVGTGRTTGSSGQTEDSNTKRYLFNYYNRAPRKLARSDNTGWTYNGTSWRQMRAQAANQVEVMIGVAEALVALHLLVDCAAGSGGWFSGNIGLNTTTAPAADGTTLTFVTSRGIASAVYNHMPAARHNTYAMVEITSGATASITAATLSGHVWM